MEAAVVHSMAHSLSSSFFLRAKFNGCLACHRSCPVVSYRPQPKQLNRLPSHSNVLFSVSPRTLSHTSDRTSSRAYSNVGRLHDLGQFRCHARSCKGHSSSPGKRSHGKVIAFRLRASTASNAPAGAEDIGRESEETRRKENGALLRAAGIVGIAATASKLLGLVRETVLAAAFGVGPVMTAFSYSSFIPTFCLSLLGGVNGPFHSAITAALSKRSQQEGRVLVERVSVLVAMVFAGLSVLVLVYASDIIDMSAPGLLAAGSPEGLATRAIAIIQLRLMAPCVLLAALIGVGFGSLSAAQVYALPSLSPSLTSLAVLLAVAIYLLYTGSGPSTPDSLLAGGVALAGGVTLGAVAQWGTQAAAQGWGSRGPLEVLRGDLLHDTGLREVLQVMIPATIGSGMLQIATYTDLFFASFLPGTAAALGYANLLVMAPLGILSSALLVPILPVFARLSKPEQWHELKQRIRQALIIAAAVTLPMTAVAVPLARPIVKLVLQRRSFDAAATNLVSSLLVCYVIGAPAYLARDVLVRVYYALGDGQMPFLISMAAIVANAALDWLLVRGLQFGPQGLVLATVLVNTLSAVGLGAALYKRLGGLGPTDWKETGSILLKAAVVSSATTSGAFLVAARCAAQLCLSNTGSRLLWAADAGAIAAAGATGVVAFAVALVVFRLPEARHAWRRIHYVISFGHY